MMASSAKLNFSKHLGLAKKLVAAAVEEAEERIGKGISHDLYLNWNIV